MIRFTVIGGYLGAGKTTLLNRILTKEKGVRYALLINDFGEINIDAKLIESQTDSQINLTNGCVCCTLVDGFHEAIDQLCHLQPPPDHIIVEASGVADVSNLAQYGYAPNLALDGVLVLADAETVQEKADDKYVATTVRRQLAAADIIILNKTDLVSEETLGKRIDWLTTTFPGATLINAEFGEVPINLLFDVHAATNPDDLHHADHEHYITWKFEQSQPTTREALESFISQLPTSVIRAKGFAGQMCGSDLLVQVVGKRREIHEVEGNQTGILLTAIGLESQLDCSHLDELRKLVFGT